MKMNKDFRSISQRRVYELENLTDISKKDIDEAKDEVLTLN